MIAAVGGLRLPETQDQSGKFLLNGGIPSLWETFLEHLHPRAVEDVKNLGTGLQQLAVPRLRPKEGFSLQTILSVEMRGGFISAAASYKRAP